MSVTLSRIKHEFADATEGQCSKRIVSTLAVAAERHVPLSAVMGPTGLPLIQRVQRENANQIFRELYGDILDSLQEIDRHLVHGSTEHRLMVALFERITTLK